MNFQKINIADIGILLILGLFIFGILYIEDIQTEIFIIGVTVTSVAILYYTSEKLREESYHVKNKYQNKHLH